jgi:hypothetical protein
MRAARWLVTLAALLAAAPAGASSHTVDARLLLDLDLLRETDLAREGDLLRRLGVVERLRVLELLRVLEEAPSVDASRPAERARERGVR